MAREHEMVSTKASIPEGVVMGYEVDVVNDRILNGMYFMGVRHIQVLNHHHYTEWKKVEEGFLRVCRSVKASLFHFMDESSLCGVNALAWTIMKYWRLSFFIHIYPKQLLHFKITPIYNYL